MAEFPFLKSVALLVFVLAAGAAAQESDKMSDQNSRWTIVNEFGNSKVYVDRESISRDGPKTKAHVRYSLNPPGTDKRNGRSVPEMYMTEEYDLEINAFRVHSIVLQYEDGSTGDPLITKPEWKPATGGNEKTLEYLRTARQS